MNSKDITNEVAQRLFQPTAIERRMYVNMRKQDVESN